MKTRAALLHADNWEALYIDGKLVEQYHEINEGEERFVYFLKIMKEYNLELSDFSYAWATEEGEYELGKHGEFPTDLDEALTWCEPLEKYEV